MGRRLLLTLVLALPVCSFAGNLTVFNTGVNSFGQALTIGQIDPHYHDTIPTNIVYTGNYGAWINPGILADWIEPDLSSGSAYLGGVYTLDYRTTVDLTGFDPASVSIVGGWATDNLGLNILVNGHATGNTSPTYSSLSGFTLSGASGFFQSGVNTLDFQWQNQGGPGGLLVEFTSATANAAGTGAPEPATFLLFGAGLAGVGLLRRRRRS
ncbi:MAG: PEP-CTERM sorting domain-containing protein [Acidobacteriota bacterium]|nr:PEP-CTERM sorting domain-containing protein [Acidobacteriota bacterium]